MEIRYSDPINFMNTFPLPPWATTPYHIPWEASTSNDQSVSFLQRRERDIRPTYRKWDKMGQNGTKIKKMPIPTPFQENVRVIGERTLNWIRTTAVRPASPML